MKTRPKTNSVASAAMPPQTALDSNAAAIDRGAVPLKPDQIAVMETMMGVFENAKRAADDAFRRMLVYGEQCAQLCGLQPNDFDLNWDLKAFVRKKVGSAKPNGADKTIKPNEQKGVSNGL